MPQKTPNFSRSSGFLLWATFVFVNASWVLVGFVIILLHFLSPKTIRKQRNPVETRSL
ncbi:hypothetical protein FEM54_08830 [Pseudomonas edaphica]|uniref:Uncharacterized protein n=1 Tax=Pseudomonas edaphica TaxID=2006980 RepID=A0ABY2U7C2_9PSED|nr:hypothetical protein FEM54_08830 [Pseudomonas edaphica]